MSQYLIEESRLTSLTPKIHPFLLKYYQLFQQQHLRDFELVGLYILTYFFQIYPRTWKGSEFVLFEDLNLPRPSLKTLMPEQVFLKTSDGSVYDFFNRYRLKTIPLSAHRSLCLWAQGTYPVELVFHIPTAHEVLTYQTQNKRMVTLLFEKSELNSFVLEQRDPLSFVIHDLIHADHFFKDASVREGQLGFYRCMLQSFLNGFFHEDLKDPDFAKGFEYLISDMNSVSLHLMMSLKTILIHAFHRKYQIPLKEKLPLDIRFRFETYYSALLTQWGVCEQKKPAFQMLNETAFCRSQHGSMIADFFRQKIS